MIKGKLARDVTVQPLALARLLHLPPSDQLSTRCNVPGSLKFLGESNFVKTTNESTGIP